jgi:hypothetical protein
MKRIVAVILMACSAFLVQACPDSTATCTNDADCPGGVCAGGQCTTGADRDGDGVADGQDNCPALPNPDQADRDGDGQGDPCDPCPDTDLNDPDQDNVCNDVDNCPADANPNQADLDGDGIGDACDGSNDDFREGGPFDPDCAYQPPRATFEPEEELGWSTSAQYPDKDQVMSTPTVVNLTDDNGDGVVDALDIPDVVSILSTPTPAPRGPAWVRACCE